MRLRLPARHSLVCQQAVELATDYLEGALSRADHRRFEKHPGTMPRLHRVPGSDSRDDSDRRPGHSRRPHRADAGRVH